MSAHFHKDWQRIKEVLDSLSAKVLQVRRTKREHLRILVMLANGTVLTLTSPAHFSGNDPRAFENWRSQAKKQCSERSQEQLKPVLRQC